MRFTVRGDHPDAAWQPGERHELKGSRCQLRGRAFGRISHAYDHPKLGVRCYVVLDNKQAGWFRLTELAVST
jgi:hypothetical protein